MERIRLEIGRVVAALPYHNHYVVRFHGEIGTVTAVAIDGAGAVRGGAKAGQAYMPGSAVFGAVFTENHPAYKFFATPHIILGALAEFPLHKENTNIVPRDIVLDSLSGYNNNQVYKNIINNEGVPTLNQDRSYNRATDSVPGDWYKSTAMGGVILLADFLTRIGASERSFLDFNSIDDSLCGSFDALDLDAEATRLRVLNYGNELLRIHSDALTRGEGLGAFDGLAPFISAEDSDLDARVITAGGGQIGFFRHEELAGGPVQGFMRTLKTDYPGTLNPLAAGEFDPLAGTLREDARMDGRYRLQAMKEIRLEKRFLISVPYEIDDETPEDEEYEVPDEFDREQAEGFYGIDGYADNQHVLQAQRLQDDVDKFQNPSLKRRSNWKEPTLAELQERLDAQPQELPPLSDEADAYSLEDLASIIAEILPGRRIRLFKNNSMFLMADDGSVSINDGYGAEIRMERGNITIACAGDLKLQPGRDLIEYVPRDKVVRARKRVEISSEAGSVRVKAEENLHLLSGNGGVGSTVIENKASSGSFADIDSDRIRQGEAIAAGIHLRSRASGVSMLGSFIYGGGYSPQATKTEGLSPAACNILLDGGPAPVVLQGGSASVMGVASASVALTGTVDGVYVASGTVSTVSAGQITQTAQTVYLQGGGGASINKAFVDRNGVQTRRVTVPNFSTNLVVRGQITGGNNLGIRGNILATGSIGANGTVGTNAAPQPTVPVPEGNASAAAEIHAITVETLQRFLTETVGIQTEYGHAVLEFAFPEGRENFSIPSTIWQADLSGTAVWEEKPVNNRILDQDTFAYPGAYEGEPLLTNGVYLFSKGEQSLGDGATIINSLATRATSKDGYKINTLL